MRYLAQRIRTGQWLHRDLPLADVQRARVLSGPGIISGRIEPELFRQFADDGLRILDPWYSTMLYCESEDGRLLAHGIIQPPMSWAAAATTVNAAGVTSYPHGYIYPGVKNYGPSVLGEEPPDSIFLFRDLWEYLQAQEASNIGVEVVGPEFSGIGKGTFDEPFLMSVWKGDDIGGRLDELASGTPFDYVEETQWGNEEHDSAALRVRIGFPRIGYGRTDMRFVEGENITQPVEPQVPEGYCNDVTGFGNGSGSTLVWQRVTVDDGRLRRPRAVTDKTIKDGDELARLCRSVLQRYQNINDVDVTQISISNHPNAPIAAIDPGDDIFVQAFVPAFGDVKAWFRVLAISQNEDDTAAVLSLARSATFFYNTDVQLDTTDAGVPA